MKIIEKIEIKHFRSVFEENIEELDSFNVFGGQNDSGKSNVLRALNLFFNNQSSFLEEFDFRSDFSMVSKIKARESKKGRKFISIKIFFNVSEIKGKSGLKRLAKQNGGLWVERQWWEYSEDGSYNQIIPPFIQSADQGIKRSFSVFLRSIKFVYIPAFKSAEVFSYVLALSAQVKGLFLSPNAKGELDKNIENTTREFSKDFSDITNIKTSITLPVSLESFWRSLEINSQFEGTPEKISRGVLADYQIKFTSRGEGIKSLFIPVVLGWLARKADSLYWIWGIDEPENALEALRADNLFTKFVEYAENAQIFVSTHSPSFLFPQEEGAKEVTKVFLASQSKPGETRFDLLSDRTNGLESIFGYNYGSFLRIQEEYSQNIKEQDKLQQELVEIQRTNNTPLLFVEGQSDKDALEAAWGALYPRQRLPFSIFQKNGADQVAYAMENAMVFGREVVFGLFDFDMEGFQRWNGLQGHGFAEKAGYIPKTGLVREKTGNRFFALLLPVPSSQDIRNQVIDPINNSHFSDRSKLYIEHLFYGVPGLGDYFVMENTPGGGRVVVFHGNTSNLIADASRIGVLAFENFKPLFVTLGSLAR